MKITDFLNENVYVVSIVLCIIGKFLKQTPKIPNWSIPYILSIIGIISCLFILGINFSSVLQGLLLAGVSVYVHQLGKHCPLFSI